MPLRPATAIALLLVLTACPTPPPAPAEPIDAVAYAAPIVGTAGGGWGQPQVFVGATTPFGLVKLGPDTAGDLPRDVVGWAHTSGYWYLDRFIEGFSHLHLSGTGIEDLGNFLLMPTAGMTADKTTEDGYRQAFSHANEEARAGHYRVVLDDTGVEAELTATPHAGVHRYRFPADTVEPTLILDVGHGLGRPGALDAEVAHVGDGLVEGWMLSAGRFTGTEGAFEVYVSLTLEPAPVAVGTWDAGELRPGEASVRGADIGLYAELPPGTEEVLVRVGVSLLDADQARLNRAQVDGRDFDEVREEAEERWRRWLSRVEVVTDDEQAGRVFSTALYHTAMMPTRYSEPLTADPDGPGRYRGLDRAVHDDDGVAFYSDLSLWDTYRTAHPLYALLAPDHAEAMATSLLRMTEQHGTLPRWPLAVNETGTMLGTPAAIVLADTWLRGARAFDVEAALEVALADADAVPDRTTRAAHPACLAHGFCPREEVGRAVAHAAEWGWADFALGQLLRARGEDEEAERLLARANLLVGHLDPATGFVRGRASDGAFDPPEGFDPTALGEDYAEGNAWQYTWSAPFTAGPLAEALGGRDRLLEKTEELFELSRATPPRYLTEEYRQADPYYWHGNEPDLFAAFVPLLLGDADATARHVRWILDTKYDDSPSGLDGNDDGGTLSAWYVLAALGLFPLPGSDAWLLVAPRFDELRLIRSSGVLSITVEREAPDALFLQDVFLDDTPVSRAFLHHEELAGASRLRFVVGSSPVGFGRDAPWVDEEGRR